MSEPGGVQSCEQCAECTPNHHCELHCDLGMEAAARVDPPVRVQRNGGQIPTLHPDLFIPVFDTKSSGDSA